MHQDGPEEVKFHDARSETSNAQALGFQLVPLTYTGGMNSLGGAAI